MIAGYMDDRAGRQRTIEGAADAEIQRHVVALAVERMRACVAVAAMPTPVTSTSMACPWPASVVLRAAIAFAAKLGQP